MRTLTDDLPRRHILAILRLSLHVPIDALVIPISRIDEPHIPDPHLPQRPTVDLEHNRDVPEIIPAVHELPQPRQRRDQDPPRQHPPVRRCVHLHVGPRRRHVPLVLRGHVAVVGAGDGPVAELRQVGLRLGDRSVEGAADVAVGEGRGLEAAGVEEEVGRRAGDAPEVFEPGLVGAGVGEDWWERVGFLGGVEEGSSDNRGSITTLQVPFVVSFCEVLGGTKWVRERGDGEDGCEE